MCSVIHLNAGFRLDDSIVREGNIIHYQFNVACGKSWTGLMGLPLVRRPQCK